jgi:Na+/H+-dicarboxylate symporter
MIVIPLIVSSLIAGLARLDARQSGRIGSLTVAYYLSTTVIAVGVRFVCGNKNKKYL